METNLAALLGGLAATVGIYAHGVVGHRWLIAQLRAVRMEPTSLSVRLFGDRDVSRQVLAVTWHCVTAVFAATAAALYLSAFGALDSRELLRFIAIVYVAFLAVGLVYVEKRPAALLQPIPLTFLAAMVGAASGAWIASGSV